MGKWWVSMKQFNVMIGLPRSGSTVLAALLNQNPDIYVSPTSPVLGYLLRMQEGYDTIEESIANPDFQQLTNMCRSMIESAWEHKTPSCIIDKHRGWGKNLPALKTVLGKNVKVIATTRDLPSVMASWLTLIKSYPYEFDKKLAQQGYANTDENRMGEMWFNMSQDAMESLCMARKTAPEGYMLEVNYDEFLAQPYEMLAKIEDHLEIRHFDGYRINSIHKLDEDNDMKAWGFPDLHKIRNKLGKTSKNPKEVLGDDLYNRFVEIEKQYV